MKKLLLLALLVACDDDDPARHLDAGQTDAPPLIDAAAQPVTLTITLAGQPRPNIVVHFQNADSSLVATATTDANGTASHVMDAGGYVTAIDPFPPPSALSNSELRTFAGVKPGDHLRLSEDFNPATVSMTITLPQQISSNVTRYTVTSPCSPGGIQISSSGSGFTPSGSMLFRSACTSSEVLVLAFDSSNAVVEYFDVPTQTITANADVDYSSKSYTAAVSKTYTFNNRPQTASIAVYQHIGTAQGEFGYVDGATSTVSDSLTLKVPAVANAIGLVESVLYAAQTQHTFFDWGPYATTAFTTDLAARKLVDVSAASYAVATHTVNWTESAGAAPNVSFFAVFGTRTTATNGTYDLRWEMIAPHGGPSATLPTLPGVDYNFDADDNVFVNELVLAKVPGGYDAIRADGFIVDRVINSGETFDLASATAGTAELVRWPLLQLQPAAPRALPTVLQHRTRR